MLELIRSAVDCVNAKQEDTLFFIRDDDVGWADDRMSALLDRMFYLDIPIDLAVIPMAATTDTVNLIRRLRHQKSGLLRLHQHGFMHSNHQENGRKCEFGKDRSEKDQKSDIEKGAKKIHAAFGELVDPIFTPPWNRCTQTTVDVLAEAGFRVLSRDATASPLDTKSIRELPITIDWLKGVKGTLMSATAFLDYACTQITENKQVGIMLHHELMNKANLNFLTEFLEPLADCPKAKFCSMAHLGDLE